MKVNRNVPLALILIPLHLESFNLKTLEMEQCIESINIVILCFNLILPTSKLLHQSLEYMQLEAGLDSPILLSPFDNYRYLCTED